MICEAYISTKITGLTQKELDEIAQTILSFYPKYKIESTNYHFYIQLMKQDKKNEKNNINCTLLENIGVGVIDGEVEVEMIVDALNYYAEL